MTQKSQGTVGARVLLREAQNYRASLECLMTLGRSLLTVPSLEAEAGDAFKEMTHEVLDAAGHEGDLAVVEGVVEPEARIELIMQDVLTPRLTEVEAIEQALAAKAEDEAEVPFTTRDAETAASMEALDRKVEMLELFQENIKNVKAFIISNESLDVELVRPMVKRIVERAGQGAASFGVSLESVETTQVLGEMASAVERIEALVDKAHETASSAADSARAEAAAIGSDGQDKIGDLIERHRSDNPAGAQLDAGTSVTTVPKDTPNQADGINSPDEQQGADNMVNQAETDVAAAAASGAEGDDAASGSDDDGVDPLDAFVAEQGQQDNAENDAGAAVDDSANTSDVDAGGADDSGNDDSEVDPLDQFAENYTASEGDDDTEEDRPLSNIGGDDDANADASSADQGTADDSGENTDAPEEDELDKAAAAFAASSDAQPDTSEDDDAGADAGNAEGETDGTASDGTDADAGTADTSDDGVATAKITTNDENEEDEDGDKKPSTESLGNAVTIENAAYRIGDEGDKIRGYVLNLLTLLSHNEMLTEQGQAALQQIQSVDSKDFVLTSDMFTEKAADVLIRHYDTWIAAAFRDGDANLTAISALLEA